MKLPKIINYIKINGENVEFDTLPIEERCRIAEVIQENIMLPIGYIRKNTA